MATVADTTQTTRGRSRVGRRVRYTPTAAEVTTFGIAGPYAGAIARVRTDGTYDLLLDLPSNGTVPAAAPTIAAADPTAIAAADATVNGVAYVQADVNTIGTLANDLKARQAQNRTSLVELKADFNTLAAVVDGVKTDATQRLKTSVRQGGGLGQFVFA